jgi:thiol-disulfide isomerase/thioredoxin
VVFDFWATWCGWCFKGFPNLERVYGEFKDDDQVVILTVNTDNPDVTDKEVQESFDKFSYKLPIVRDPEENNTKVFRVTGLPTMYILGPDGTVQDVETGYKEDLAAVLPAKLKRLKAGENLAKETLDKYQESINAYDKEVNEATVGSSAQIEIPVTEIAPFSQPSPVQL